MDPNETLRELREAVTRWHEADLFETERGAAEDMAALVDSLDEWITAGGFLPNAWSPTRRVLSVPSAGLRVAVSSPEETHRTIGDLLEDYDPSEIEWEA